MMHKLHIALKQKLDEAQAIINEMMGAEPEKMEKEEYLDKSEEERAEYDGEQMMKKDKEHKEDKE